MSELNFCWTMHKLSSLFEINGYKPYEQEDKTTIGTVIQGKHWKIGSRMLLLHVVSRTKINNPLNRFEAEITKTVKQLKDEDQNRGYL